MQRVINVKSNIFNKMEILDYSTKELVEFIKEKNENIFQNSSRPGWTIQEIKYH